MWIFFLKATLFIGGYRSTRAGKKVQAAKQAKENKKKEQIAKNTERNVSTIKKTAILLHAIAEECSFTQSTVKPKNVSIGASLRADGMTVFFNYLSYINTMLNIF